MHDPRPENHASPSGESAQLDRAQLQQRAINGAMWTLVSTVVGVGVGFFVNILLARTLGVVDFGRLAYLTTVIGVLGSVAAVGVGTGVVQFGSKLHARGDGSGVQDLLSKSQGFRLLVTAPVMTLGVLALVRVDWVLMALAIVFGVWVTAAVSGAPDALVLENKTARAAQNAMLVNLLTQIGVVTVALLVTTADSVWVVRTLVGALGVVAAVPFINRKYRTAVFRPRLPRNMPQGFWRFTVPAGAAGIVGGLVVSRTEVVLLTWMSEASAAGLFALAFGLASHVFSPAQSLVGPLIPAVSGLHEVDRSAVLRALGRTLRTASVAIGLSLGSAMPAFAILVPVIYGPDYASVPPILLALGVSGGISVLVGPVLAFVQARLQGRWLLWVNLLALVVDLGLALALIPWIGVWGAVVANIGGVVIRLALLLGGEVRTLSYPATRVLRDVAPVAIGALVCWAAWLTPDLLGLGTSVAEAVVGSLLAGAGGLMLMLVLMRISRTGLVPSDRRAIAGALPRRFSAVSGPFLRLVSHSREG